MRQIHVLWRSIARLNWGLGLIALAAALRVCGFMLQKSWPRWRVPLPGFLGHWRRRFIECNEGSDGLGLVRGMFLGDASALPGPVLSLFQEGGLTHLVAASGFNCLIVGLLLRTACMPALRRLPGGASALTERCCETFGAVLFWCWTDQSPTITRAAALSVARLALTLLGVPVPFLRLLFVQYLISLCIAPHLWRSASFQLSFSCLFGVLVGARLARAAAAGHRPSLVSFYLCTNAGACLAVAPVTWVFFGEANFTGLLTNWVAVPPVSAAIMPLALIQMALLAVPGSVAFAAGRVVGIVNGWFCGLYFEALRWLIEHGPSLRYAPFRD